MSTYTKDQIGGRAEMSVCLRYKEEYSNRRRYGGILIIGHFFFFDA